MVASLLMGIAEFILRHVEGLHPFYNFGNRPRRSMGGGAFFCRYPSFDNSKHETRNSKLSHDPFPNSCDLFVALTTASMTVPRNPFCSIA